MSKSRMIKFVSVLLIFSVLSCQIVVCFADTIKQGEDGVAKIKGKDKIIYDIKDDDIHDIIIIEDGGDVYLNGSLVKISSSGSTDSVASPNSTNSTYTAIVNSPPAGTKASDYTKLIGTEKKSIEFDKSFGQMTLKGIALLFAYTVGDPEFGADDWYKVLLEFSDIMNSDFSYSKAMSVEIKTYQHKNGQMITTDTAANKLVIRCYGNGDYTGYLGTDTRYKMWVYR